MTTAPGLVAVGGALGAVLRHAVYLAVERRTARPRATLLVNVVGSFALGGLVAAAPSDAVLLLGVGACGAFTTFSTFAVETVDAVEDGGYAAATVTATVNLAGALAAVALAWGLVGAL